MVRWIERLERFGRWLEDGMLVAVLGTMVLLAALQILLRNAFDAGFIWGDQLLRIMVLWVGMLGAIAASRQDKHIRIDVLGRFLDGRAKLLVSILVYLFTAVVAGLAAWYSGLLVLDERQFGAKVMGTVPSWTVQTILPLGFGLIAYRYLTFFLRDGYKLLVGKPQQ